MIILKNGFIDMDNVLVKKDILIKNNVIAVIADSIEMDFARVYDISGHLVIPGAVDVHVHLREPGFPNKETIKAGTFSAAKGGITTIMTMPNLRPCPHNLEGLKAQMDIILRGASVRIYPYASVSVNEEGKELSDIDRLAPYVKAFSDDGSCVNNVELLTEAMKKVQKQNLIISSHAEDEIDGKLPSGEYNAVSREVKLAMASRVKYHFCHLSTAESFRVIAKAKRKGADISAEVTPHHLFLNEENICNNPNFKMNPPLRSKQDQEATIDALLSGVVDIIASDHAPHTEDEKNTEYDQSPNGIIGLETLIPLVYTNLVKNKKAKIQDMINWITINPAKRFNLPYSEIKVHSMADITVLDIETEREYKKSEIVSLGKNSPFIGTKLTGFPVLTLVGGRVVYESEYEIEDGIDE